MAKKQAALQRWGTLWSEYARRFDTPRARTVALTCLFFLLALVVYRLTAVGPWWEARPPAADGPLRLADAFLHGRLDVANGEELPWLDWAFYNGKYYVLEPPMMAIVVLPGVLLYGLALNQTLVSVVIGSLTVAVVFALMRALSREFSLQVWLTLLFGFGTIFWWNTTNGGIWYFAHPVSVLFLFVAIYETLVSKRPFTAGLALGAAYMARLPTLLALPFFVIMFSEQWLLKAESGERPLPLWERVNLKPLVQLGLGVGIFFGSSLVYNYLRFEDPLNTGYSVWAAYQGPENLLQEGLFDISYVSRNFPVFFQAVPIFLSSAPYVYPSWSGMAFWATTPAFLYALFAGIRSRLFIASWSAVLLLTVMILFFAARGVGWFGLSYDANYQFQLRFSGLNSFLYDLTVYPFLILVAFGLFVGFRNKLVLACWSAIIPIVIVHFIYPIAGWPMFGFRYALDYYPFLFLLVWVAIGSKIRWHHMLLITASIMINFAGVLWINKFEENQFLGFPWVNW